MKHAWVKHVLQQIEVEPLPLSDAPRCGAPEQEMWFDIKPVGDPQSVIGCDNCGLALTPELFEEPCLAKLEDQLESEEEDGA